MPCNAISSLTQRRALARSLVRTRASVRRARRAPRTLLVDASVTCTRCTAPREGVQALCFLYVSARARRINSSPPCTRFSSERARLPPRLRDVHFYSHSRATPSSRGCARSCRLTLTLESNHIFNHFLRYGGNRPHLETERDFLAR